MKNLLVIFIFFLIPEIYPQDADDLDLLDKEDLDFLDKKDDEDLDTPDTSEANPPPPKEDIFKKEEEQKKADMDDSPDEKEEKKAEDEIEQVLSEEDVPVDLEEEVVKKEDELDKLEKDDDLEALKEDIGESIYEKEQADKSVSENENLQAEKQQKESFEPAGGGSDEGKAKIFDVGEEERKLLELSKYIMGKIPQRDWSEIATSSQNEQYVVQKGDWLWKISKKLFGTGFYYSKIWALNPHITNPHEIEPGTVLVLNTGDEDEMPIVRLKKFATDESGELKEIEDKEVTIDLTGNFPVPNWIAKRKKLIEQGVFFQFTSNETYEDLERLGRGYSSEEYKSYDPPLSSIVPLRPVDEYEEEETRGFDKSSRINVDFSEGFYLTTFITSNIVQDLGELVASSNVSNFITDFKRVFVKFDPSVKVRPGDYYSVYNANGKYQHPDSERSGYRYTIIAQIRAIGPKDDLWECEISDISGLVERNSRITKYTPKIEKIVKTFSQRTIEGLIIGTIRDSVNSISYGDVVFLDRGRLDGVENGTVFEIFSSIDELTGKNISIDP
ncbi:MAG: LysM domain-containing protein, partial [Halobacteriovoraceae bacterium]|nr:LysM domain-containing protein [Halobacteriovoraceae bacterium]